MSHCDTTQDMVTVRSWRTLLVAERIVDRALGFGGWVLLVDRKGSVLRGQFCYVFIAWCLEREEEEEEAFVNSWGLV